jgi:hypothetical protein
VVDFRQLVSQDPMALSLNLFKKKRGLGQESVPGQLFVELHFKFSKLFPILQRVFCLKEEIRHINSQLDVLEESLDTAGASSRRAEEELELSATPAPGSPRGGLPFSPPSSPRSDFSLLSFPSNISDFAVPGSPTSAPGFDYFFGAGAGPLDASSPRAPTSPR